jgi:hypothetical protein
MHAPHSRRRVKRLRNNQTSIQKPNTFRLTFTTYITKLKSNKVLKTRIKAAKNGKNQS